METSTEKSYFGTKAHTEEPTTASTQSVPIILCGKTLEVGTQVTQLIQPELQVIHFVNSFEEAKDNLGDLIAGRGPRTPSSNDVGTHDYSKPSRAVIFGRAFKEDQVKELFQLHRGKGTGPVAWIAGDPDFKLPARLGPNYAQAGADNVKKAFANWRESGAVDDDIVYY